MMNNNNSINSSNIENDFTKEEKLSIFNFESLITIEEILTFFFNNEIKLIKNNFINYYKIINYYQINKLIKEIFTKSIIQIKIEKLFNLQFLSVLIEGLYLSNLKNNNHLINSIRNCLSENHQNFLLLSYILINELQYKNMTNIYSNKIYKFILDKLQYKNTNNTKDIFLKIDEYNNKIENQIKLILNSNNISYTLPKGVSNLPSILGTVEKSSSDSIFDYCLKILEVPENIIKEIKSRTYLSNQDEEDASPIYPSVKVPFLSPLKKGENIPLTVVLDLDETLIGFEKEENNDEENEEYEEDEEDEKIVFRPGLFNFLNNLLKLKCELIIFSSSNKGRADKLIDEIEKNKKYFKKRLYRENCTLIGSAYIKDISKLGRDLSKVIIIDNDLACFYLQQENGILIKPFNGNNNDKILDNLYDILNIIFKNSFQDIRIELEKYKDKIKNNVTS